MLDNLREDTRRLKVIKPRSFPWYVLESLLFENGYQAVVLYRIASWFRHRRVPLLGPLVGRLSLFLTSVDISPAAVIGPGLYISHGTGIVIGGKVRMGAQATLLHGVTIGAPTTRRIDQMPVLGDEVFVGAGSRIIGAVTVGDGCFIGLDTVVTEDVPPHTKVTAVQDVRYETLPAKEPDPS
jgi:serine O-acetyltransferase